MQTDAETGFDVIPVWKQVTPELMAELIAFWTQNKAIANTAQAAVRASQAVCIARDDAGALCGVGTAVVRVLPRLRQPMYYYRQYFAPRYRGHKQAAPFMLRAKQVLEQYNATLPASESLGVLLELENQRLAKLHFSHAHSAVTDSTFIGYSPGGLQLRVSYFKDAALLEPVRLPLRAVAPRRN